MKIESNKELGMENFTKLAFNNQKKEWVDLNKAIPLVFPISINIELSGKCNYKCVFCIRNTQEFQDADCSQHMSKDTYALIMESLLSSGSLRMLYFNGTGESLYNPDFTEIIRSVPLLKVTDQSLISTNGSMLNEENARAIVESGLDYIRISINSMIQEMHEKITQSKININEIYNNVLVLKNIRDKTHNKKPQIIIKMFDTFSEENDLFMRKYSSLADTIFLEKLDNWNGIDDFVGNMYKFRTQDIQKKAKMDFAEREIGKKKICPRPFYKCLIRNNGDVSICENDPISNVIMGNIHANTLKEIWDGSIYEKLRLDFLDGHQKKYLPCKNCRSNMLVTSEANIDSLTPSEYLLRRQSKEYL
jgi:radical SAM protein with 4Fe4S-binding SPASM domain